MQSSQLETLRKYNELLELAIASSAKFPNQLCDYIVSENGFEAALLFNALENKELILSGKSSAAKKSYEIGATYSCSNCKSLNSISDVPMVNSQEDCQIQSTEYMIYERCFQLNIHSAKKYLFKIAKKTPFTPADDDAVKSFSILIKNLLSIWSGSKPSPTVSLSNLISEISQELRTPTNSIMGFASLLSEEKLTSSQSEYVSTLKGNAYNLLALINDLVEIAKLENGELKENLSTLSVSALLDELTKNITEKSENKNIDIIQNIDKNVPQSISLDLQKARCILSNILLASFAITGKGKIAISAKAIGNNLEIIISDTSTGIPSSKVNDIFKPFGFQKLLNAPSPGLTGLSLTLAKLTAEQMNGDIKISSTVGKGNTFTIRIPYKAAADLETQLSALPKPGKKNKVLVVEDDYATSKLLSNYLNKWGYEPTIVNSAEQTLKIIEKEQFLAILMDIVLPDANGFDLLKKIHENKNTKNTPVIVCSVESEQQKAFMMGAVEYFVKPIKYKYLVEVLTSYKLKKDSNILIVDDDVPTLNLIKEAVQQAGFNAIAEAHSGKLPDMLDSLSIDLAIIDLDMPELSGFDLIKIIKSNPKFAKLPIIIYTGKENYADDLKKIDGLFADLLEKSSVNIEDLAQTVNDMINSFDQPADPKEIMKKDDVLKILLVEDYKHSQIIVTRLLKKNNYDNIVVVENGAEALEAVKQQKYDLILMDMQMPVMNGFEATKKIRELPEYKDTPIIALTAFAMKGDKEKCLDAGATDYLPKPIDSVEFINKVKYYTELKINAS